MQLVLNIFKREFRSSQNLILHIADRLYVQGTQSYVSGSSVKNSRPVCLYGHTIGNIPNRRTVTLAAFTTSAEGTLIYRTNVDLG